MIKNLDDGTSTTATVAGAFSLLLLLSSFSLGFFFFDADGNSLCTNEQIPAPAAQTKTISISQSAHSKLLIQTTQPTESGTLNGGSPTKARRLSHYTLYATTRHYKISIYLSIVKTNERRGGGCGKLAFLAFLPSTSSSSSWSKLHAKPRTNNKTHLAAPFSRRICIPFFFHPVSLSFYYSSLSFYTLFSGARQGHTETPRRCFLSQPFLSIYHYLSIFLSPLLLPSSSYGINKCYHCSGLLFRWRWENQGRDVG